MKRQKQDKVTIILVIVYILAVIWIILFKFGLSFNGLNHMRNINLIPFGGSAIVNGALDTSEIINNILIFIPFGIYICMLKQNWVFIKKVIPIFIFSLILETLQFIFAMGATDITDLIGNTLGGVIGIGIFYLFFKIFKDKTSKILTILTLIATVAMIALIGLLLIVNR